MNDFNKLVSKRVANASRQSLRKFESDWRLDRGKTRDSISSASKREGGELSEEIDFTYAEIRIDKGRTQNS